VLVPSVVGRTPIGERDQYDVIVVGGGPAGSTAAWHLADAGDLDVLVVDRKPFPRHKTCGGALVRSQAWPGEFPNYAAVEPDLPRHPVSSVDLRVDRAPWWAGDGEPFFDHVKRTEFDDALLQAATARPGVSFRVFDVKNVDRRSDGSVQLTDGASTLSARAVIGADGCYSRVSRALGNPVRTGVDAGSCLVHDLVCDQPHQTAVIYYLWGSQPGYGYLFPTADGYCAGVGYIGPAGRQVKRHLADMLAHCTAEGLLPKKVTTRRTSGAVAPTTRTEHVAGEGVLLTGDAAGLLSQLSGEGIYYAMKSGQLAALALTEDLDRAHERYAAAVKPLQDKVTYARPLRPRLLYGTLRTYLAVAQLGMPLKRPFVDRLLRRQGAD